MPFTKHKPEEIIGKLCEAEIGLAQEASAAEALIQAVPYHLHTILTDNGIQFADLPKNRNGWTARLRAHRFYQIRREHGIEHRLTKPNHPWTNGQVERMNRTIQDATVKRYHYDNHDQL